MIGLTDPTQPWFNLSCDMGLIGSTKFDFAMDKLIVD